VTTVVSGAMQALVAADLESISRSDDALKTTESELLFKDDGRRDSSVSIIFDQDGRLSGDASQHSRIRLANT